MVKRPLRLCLVAKKHKRKNNNNKKMVFLYLVSLCLRLVFRKFERKYKIKKIETKNKKKKNERK